MSDIEFLAPAAEPEAAVPTADDEGPPTRWESVRRQIPTTGATALWTAAAVLAVVAPLTTIYTEAIAGEGEIAIDGWGRVFVRAGYFGQVTHAPRYGVPLAVCAAVCAALAVVVAVAAWRGIRLRGRFGAVVVPATGMLAGGAMLGVAGSAWASVQAVRDAFAAQNNQTGLPFTTATMTGGPFWLLSGLAGLAAVLGSVASWLPVPAPPAAAPPAAPTPAADETPAAPDAPAEPVPPYPDEAGEPLAITVLADVPVPPPSVTEGEELLGER